MVFEIIHRMYTHNKSIQVLMMALMTSNLNSSLHYSFVQRVLDNFANDMIWKNSYEIILVLIHSTRN